MRSPLVGSVYGEFHVGCCSQIILIAMTSSSAHTPSRAAPGAGVGSTGPMVDGDQSYVRLPFECLNRSFRTNQKVVERDLQQCLAAIENAAKTPATAEGAVETLDGILAQLQGLKRKVGWRAAATALAKENDWCYCIDSMLLW